MEDVVLTVHVYLLSLSVLRAQVQGVSFGVQVAECPRVSFGCAPAKTLLMVRGGDLPSLGRVCDYVMGMWLCDGGACCPKGAHIFRVYYLYISRP